MAIDYEALIADPQLVDPSIDITGFRTQTDTNPLLLGNIAEYPGIKYDPTHHDFYSNLYAIHSGNLPMHEVAQDTAQIPGAVDTLVNVDGGAGTGTTTGGVNTPFEQNLIDEGAGVQIAPGQPVVAPGEMPVTQAEMDAYNQIPPSVDYPDAYTSLGEEAPRATYADQYLDDLYETGEHWEDTSGQVGIKTPTYVGGERTLADAGAGIDNMYATDFGYPEDDLMDYDEHYDMDIDTMGPKEQAAEDAWKNKEIIRTPGGDMIVDTVTGQIEKDIADFYPSENERVNKLAEARKLMTQETPVDVPGRERVLDFEDPYRQNYISPGRIESYPIGTQYDPSDQVAFDQDFIDAKDYSAPGTLADPAEKIDFVSEADAANPKTLLDKLGLSQFNAAEAFVKTAINMAVGKPITFFIDVLKGIIPPMDPRQKALNEFYKTDAIGRVAKGELMAGYNPVYGGVPGVSEPTYGLQEAYQERIDNVTDTLQNKYGLTDAEIDSIKAGNITDAIKDKAINATMTETYGKPTATNNLQKLADLEAAKKAEELATRGARKLVSGDIEDRDLYHDVALQDKKVGIEDEFSGLETALGIPNAADTVETIPVEEQELISAQEEEMLAELAREEKERADAAAEKERQYAAAERQEAARQQARAQREMQEKIAAAEKREAERLAALNIDAGRDDGNGGGGGGGGASDDWGDMSYMIAEGGLAQHAPRGRYFNGGLIRRPYAKGGIVSVMPTKFNKY